MRSHKVAQGVNVNDLEITKKTDYNVYFGDG